MAFEGLLARLGPSFVREMSPHLVQLVGSFLERFRKDTSAMKASVDAEIVSLRQTQAAFASTAAQQAEAVVALGEQLGLVEQKIDRLQQSHDELGRQLTSVEEQMRLASRTPAGLLWSVFALVLMTFGVVVGLLFLHR